MYTSIKIILIHSDIETSVLVTDFIYDSMLGPEILTVFGFIVDIPSKVLPIGNGYSLFSFHNLQIDKIIYDTRIPANSDTIVTAKIGRSNVLGACLVESVHE